MQKLVSILVILAVLVFGALAYAYVPATAHTNTDTKDRAVPADILPPDLSGAPAFETKTPVKAQFRATTGHVSPQVKVWTCGAPRKLENDAFQTVRECEFR